MSPIIRHLKGLHARLDSEISREQKARRPDEVRVKRLKKLRLAIKDRLFGRRATTA